MIILILFAFLAGIITILSPCILPILPVILSSSLSGDGSRTRPYGVILGFILSFTFFTLFLSLIVQTLGVGAETLRSFAVIIIATFGLTLLLPRFQLILESLFARVASLTPNFSTQRGLTGGLMIGFSLGLLWTPCVGPILASVISLAISGSVTFDAFILTLAYSLGTAIPMYLIILGGNKALTRVPWLLNHTKDIQRIFGLVMIATAILIHFGLDRSFQTYILSKYPQYGSSLTIIEDNDLVKENLLYSPQ